MNQLYCQMRMHDTEPVLYERSQNINEPDGKQWGSYLTHSSATAKSSNAFNYIDVPLLIGYSWIETPIEVYHRLTEVDKN